MVYLKYIVLILCALLAISGKQVYKEFGNITYEQLLFHLQVPFILDGINLKSVIKMVVLTYGLPCIGLLLSLFVVEKFLLKRKMFQNLFYTFLLLGCLGVSQFYWHFDRLFQEMQQTRIYGDFYEKHYIQPQVKNLIFPQEKRNLIVIVLESMEKTFSPHSPTTQDSSNSSKLLSPFGNLTPNLTKLSQSHISFKDPLGGGGQQSFGVSWSIAGLVGYYCSIPLKLPIDGNSFGDKIPGLFLGGAVCLGDILANQGYQQTSLLPHHKNFSGAGLFFKTHKVETKDLEYYQTKKMLPENYGGFWGVNSFKDAVLFDLAKQELMQFDKNKPFALYLLSIDTHSKTGYTDKERCKALFDSPKNSNEEYQNAIFCTDTLLGEFVAWIKKQDFYPNTTIVILGDHLSMNYEFFPKNTHRTIYNAFINPDFYTPLARERLNHRLFSHFDILPTLLDSLKVNVKGGKLGLGVDLLSTQPTLLESGDFEAEIQKRSKVYEGFLYQSDNAYP